MSHGSPAPDSPPETPSSSAGRQLRWLIGLAIAVVVLATTIYLFRLAAARRIAELTSDAFDAAIERWEAAGPDSYDMELEIRGNRPGTVLVQVRQGEVVRMQRNGYVPSQRRTWDVWSVPGQFDTIEREMEMAADPESQLNARRGTKILLRCDFDPELGYPVKFHRAVSYGGPEVYWRVTRFEPK